MVNWRQAGLTIWMKADKKLQYMDSDTDRIRPRFSLLYTCQQYLEYVVFYRHYLEVFVSITHVTLLLKLSIMKSPSEPQERILICAWPVSCQIALLPLKFFVNQRRISRLTFHRYYNAERDDEKSILSQKCYKLFCSR
jgi:hypothetical protein